jgi:hypothetical protein
MSQVRVVSGLILDLEDSIARGTDERRADTLRRVTDLFLRDAEQLTEDQIDLFDVVIARLAAAIETRARAELADRLADIAKAPRGVIRSLAHDEIVVARPVLSRSERLTDEDLVAVALAKGRDHMLAITERPMLTEPVTDVLVSRGDRVVVHAVTGNPGARFSEGSMATLVDRSRADEALQALLQQRPDLPETHLRQLVAIAKETARKRLAGSVPVNARGALDHAVERSASRVSAAVLPNGRDYTQALGMVEAIADERPLTETDIATFARDKLYEEVVCSLALMVGLSIAAAERLFTAGEADLLLVVAKAQGWSWPTVKLLLAQRPGGDGVLVLRKAQQTYGDLSPTTAQRVVHFLKVRETAQKKAAEAAASRQLRLKQR